MGQTRPADVFELEEVRAYDVAPLRVVTNAAGHVFIDFGRAAFGWLEVEIDSPDEREIEVRLGEKAVADDAVDPKRGGSVRYVATTLAVQPGKQTYRVRTPADKRNTSGEAIRVPEEFGVVLPFRYVELRNTPGEIVAASVRQKMLAYPFDDDASAFQSSNRNLNAVWDLCKYSIRATSAFGIYVDGDGNRERIP